MSVKEQLTRKRRRLEVVDVTPTILSKLSTIPPTSIAELKIHLEQPLLDTEKIPVTQDFALEAVPTTDALDTMNWCSQETLNELFFVDDGRSATQILKIFSHAVTNRPWGTDGTEFSFISFWDGNIAIPLMHLIPGSRPIRDSNHCTNTDLQRPDFGLLLDLLCLFRGEEKPLKYTGKHPRLELIDKLTWRYDPAPYILAYFAIGTRVTYAAITCDEGHQKKVFDLKEFNLLHKADRVRNLIYLLRVASVLRGLKEVVPDDGRADFVGISRDDGLKEVNVGGKVVHKLYLHPDGATRVRRLQNIYRLLHDKGVPHVDELQMACVNDPLRGNCVYTRPVGLERRPHSQSELIRAVTCVLEALSVMHQPTPLFHRDIRWPNVIKCADSEDWFMIDWEDAAVPKTEAANHMGADNHSPRVFVDGHGSEVDIWAVGYLIQVSVGEIPGLSLELRQLGESLKLGTIATAEEALARLKSVVVN